ncbi:MAG: cob(I)yrinic acid a,c-diamide adenosyltransferase [Candidatus Taylorbacteria bacterium]|nr:cob(I)yrinic acid a,c-diamide adenosyltransferase [Candidatus Taylorbacteria bacterium]
MLYTRKGDAGTTKTFGCNQRISKSSAVAEALGALDEINSLLGFLKVKSKRVEFKAGGQKIPNLLHWIQEGLFVAQAELAGAPKTIFPAKVKEMERVVDEIEKVLPPIKTFFIPGGSELSALFDYSRTVARRAERRVIAACLLVRSREAEEGGGGSAALGPHTLAFLNRLSSLLYALARLANLKSGIKEQAPSYR